MSSEQSPFGDLANLLSQLPAGNIEKAADIKQEIAKKPSDDIIGFSGLLEWLALWQEAEVPTVQETHICVLASSYKGLGDVSIVSDYIDRASKGRAPVNHMCVKNGIGLRVLELAPDIPHDINEDWSERDCMGAIAFGMEAVASGGDLLGLSDLAPGNEGPAKAMIDAAIVLNKQKIDQVVDVQAYLDLIRCHGGREIAAMVGAIIAARSRRIPVLLEGWGGIAAYVILASIDKDYVAHTWIASVNSTEQSDALVVFEATPIVGHPVGVGPGCGIALATSVLAGMVTLLSVPDA